MDKSENKSHPNIFQISLKEGKKAEDMFNKIASDNWGWKVSGSPDNHGLGYDFECTDLKGNKLYVEVKGCRKSITKYER